MERGAAAARSVPVATGRPASASLHVRPDRFSEDRSPGAPCDSYLSAVAPIAILYEKQKLYPLKTPVMDLAPELNRPPKGGARKIFVRYAVAVCSVAAGVALRFALGPALGPMLPYITFFPAIMLAAWFGGLGPGLLATLLSLAAVFYFALDANVTGAILFVAGSVFISILTEALRRSRARSGERLRQLALETARRSSAEEALAESKHAAERSEDRLKLALDAGGIGVWNWDVVQNRIEWSDLVYDIHGVERGTFRGAVEDFAELIYPEDRERVNKAIGDALAHGTPYDVEFRVVHANGKVHWVSTTAQVFRDEVGAATRMLGVVTDATARKEAETHVLRQWRTFDTALSNTPDFTYIFDLSGRFTYINRALLSLWQRPLEDAVGKNFFDLEYPPELAARLQRQIQQVIDGKEPLRDHTPFTGPTGETRHYEYIFVPVFAADGQVESVAGSTRDVTEQYTVEEALRKSEERLTLALEAGGGVGTWDWDIASPERGAAGAPIAEFVEHIHPGDRARVEEGIRHAIETGGDFAQEYRVVPPDGPVRWLYARGRSHLNAAGNPARFPGVIFEITGLKRAEEDLRQSNEELKRVNRELEEFAYVASHDLQEPLRTVNIYTQLILRDIDPAAEKLGQYAGFIQRGVMRMEALIRDLLTFSRAGHHEELPVGTADLSTSLGEALSVLKNEIDETCAIITAGSLPIVRGDTSQMAHVFQNLLSNALKYRKNDIPPEIRVSAEPAGGQWTISVRDNGIGFEPRYADRIFGLFKRLHTKEYVGTGLGLAICKRIVERYGGRIWAEGQPGGGAAFHFSLPTETPGPDMS
jgi:PAS domain S-box-containing protein